MDFVDIDDDGDLDIFGQGYYGDFVYLENTSGSTLFSNAIFETADPIALIRTTPTFSPPLSIYVDIDPLLIADDDFSDRYRVPGGGSYGLGDSDFLF